MSGPDKHSKTEQATPQKLRKSRKEGQVAQSKDLISTVVLFGGVIIFSVMGVFVFSRIGGLLKHLIIDVNFHEVSKAGFFDILLFATKNFFIVAVPTLCSIWLIAFIVAASQVGFHVSFKPLEPNFEKLNPAKGFQKLVSMRSIVSTSLATVKMFFVALIGFAVFVTSPDLKLLLLKLDNEIIFASVKGLIWDLTIKIVAVLLILAIIDYSYQKWQFSEDQKMTKDEVKKEYKEQEGDPHIKSALKQKQRDIANKRGLKASVEEADVVVTNPVHLAVAIKYEKFSPDAAPYVIAKGSRLLAERIKEFAKEFDVEIVQNIPLARALYKNVPVDHEITPDLYMAVAEVLAFVYKKRNPPK